MREVVNAFDGVAFFDRFGNSEDPLRRRLAQLRIEIAEIKSMVGHQSRNADV